MKLLILYSLIFAATSIDPAPPRNLFAYDGATLSESPVVMWKPSISHDVDFYEFSIGTAPGKVDVLDWANIGNATAYQATGLSLQNNVDYFVNLRAVNKDGLHSITVSSPPWGIYQAATVSIEIVNYGPIHLLDVNSLFSPSLNYLGGGFPGVGGDCSYSLPVGSRCKIRIEK